MFAYGQAIMDYDGILLIWNIYNCGQIGHDTCIYSGVAGAVL